MRKDNFKLLWNSLIERKPEVMSVHYSGLQRREGLHVKNAEFAYNPSYY